MSLDGFLLGERQTVVHEPVARAQTPQRRGTDLCRRRCERCTRKHRNAVAGANVMQQEVAVRMEEFVAYGIAYTNRPTVDARARRCGEQRRDMTTIAADRVE